MNSTSLARKSSVIWVTLILLITSAKAVGANAIPIPVVPLETSMIAFLAFFSIFLFNYSINLGSAVLVFKVFKFTINLSSINKLAVTMFKVTIAGAFVMFLISGSIGAVNPGLLQYGISAILVGIVEIILLSFLLHGLYGLKPRRAVSVSTCAITFGALIGIPFALMLI